MVFPLPQTVPDPVTLCLPQTFVISIFFATLQVKKREKAVFETEN